MTARSASTSCRRSGSRADMNVVLPPGRALARTGSRRTGIPVRRDRRHAGGMSRPAWPHVIFGVAAPPQPERAARIRLPLRVLRLPAKPGYRAALGYRGQPAACRPALGRQAAPSCPRSSGRNGSRASASTCPATGSRSRASRRGAANTPAASGSPRAASSATWSRFMSFSIKATIRAWLAPEHRLTCPSRHWREIVGELDRRGENRHEAGVFLLGVERDGRREVPGTRSTTTSSIPRPTRAASASSTATPSPSSGRFAASAS